MKLATKIVVIFLLCIVPLTTVHGYLIIARENLRMRQEMERHAHSIGQTLEEELAVAWQNQGHEGVARSVKIVDRQHRHVSIGWVSMDVLYQTRSPEVPLERLSVAAADQMVSMTLRDSEGRQQQRMYYPIHSGNQRTGYLEFSEPLKELRDFTRISVLQTITVMGAMLLCGVLVALLGMRIVGRPLEQLIEKTERIGKGDFSEPVQINSNDELGQLASALNHMSDQLGEQQEKIKSESAGREAALEQLRHVDRLKTVGRLASGVAHELGTPLNVVSGRAELITSGQLDQPQIEESATIIKSEAVRMAAIIRQLLDFARRRSPHVMAVDLRYIATQCADLLQTLAKRQDVSLELEKDGPPLTAKVDAAQIQQVLTNLVVNAIHAMPAGGVVAVKLGSTFASAPGEHTGAARDYFFVSVADEGTGINEEDKQHLFEPFFTTKETGEGTGLGLSVSYGIVQDHGGWIDVESEPGKGSCFTVYLPKETV